MYKRQNKSCISCHASGAAGAPKTGDVAVWQERENALGLDGLVQSVIQGKGTMPPKGFCAQCTAENFEALIQFMASPRG